MGIRFRRFSLAIGVSVLACGPMLGTVQPHEEITRVHPQWLDQDTVAIPPGIFGDFLEHLGDAVYHTLWANVVYNPAFWQADAAGPKQWTLEGGATLAPDGHGVQMPTGAIVRQVVYLPVHRELRYRGRIWAAAPFADAKVVVRLVRANGIVAQAEVPLRTRAKADGVPFRLNIAPSGASPGEPYDLVIEMRLGTGRLTRVELFPEDAVAGMDPEVVQAAKALHISFLRWPGGNFSSGYHWRRGIGPRSTRPTVPNPAWPGLETHAFGTNEFLRFCRLIGASPMICVNAGDGTPEEAADWVEYCNGSVDTPMGRLRAKDGHPAPYHVRLWEVGNELYGPWQIGHTNAAGNGERFVAFRRAMLARDPTIKIIACGKGDGFVDGPLNADDAWNRTLLKDAVRDGSAPDMLSIHPLVPLPGGLASNAADYDKVYLAAMAHPGWFAKVFVPHLMAQMHDPLGGHLATRLAATEWGIILGGPDWQQFPNHDTQSGAIYAGLFLNALMRCGGAVEVANVTGLLHGGGIKKRRGRMYVDPMYFVQRMYGEARPDRLIPLKREGPGYRTMPWGFLPGVDDTPWVDVCAATGRGNLYLFMVNVDPHHPRRVEISLPKGVTKVFVQTLAADPRARNSGDNSQAVRPVLHEVSVHDGILAWTLDACSVNVARAEWRRHGRGQSNNLSP